MLILVVTQHFVIDCVKFAFSGRQEVFLSEWSVFGNYALLATVNIALLVTVRVSVVATSLLDQANGFSDIAHTVASGSINPFDSWTGLIDNLNIASS